LVLMGYKVYINQQLDSMPLGSARPLTALRKLLLACGHF
jgi:hypothetical protein